MRRNRHYGQVISAALVTWGVMTLAAALPPATGPSREWPVEVFDYDRPIELQVRDRPDEPQRRPAGTRQRQVIFKDLAGEDVPVLITLPERGRGPFPVVVLVHGFSSNKHQVTRQLGKALTDRGLACLAADMPKHGDRPGPPKDLFVADQPQETYRRIVQAVQDIRQTIDLAESLKELDTSKGVGLLGYSMGAWFGALAGAAERRVQALVLMVGGSAAVDVAQEADTSEELDDRQARAGRLNVLRRFAAIRPLEAIPGFAPRPILMQNGRRDWLVPAERAKALFAAAKEPKEQRWYDAGHLLGAKAYEEAADWLAKHMKRPEHR